MLSINKKSVARKTRRNVLAAVYALLAILCLPSLSHAGAYDDFFQAVKLDDSEEISSLLKRGLDPNLIEAERGDTGMILALRENSMKVFDVLLNARGNDLETKARNGDTALMVAAYKGNKRAVEALLGKQAQVNRPGWTALHYAAAVGRNDIVQLLLDNSAYIDAESPNKTTPIMMAARAGHILTVKLLLDEGADASLKTTEGRTAIDFATMHGFTDIVEGLTYRLKKSGKL
jgi:uncharacterized protein